MPRRPRSRFRPSPCDEQKTMPLNLTSVEPSKSRANSQMDRGQKILENNPLRIYRIHQRQPEQKEAISDAREIDGSIYSDESLRGDLSSSERPVFRRRTSGRGSIEIQNGQALNEGMEFELDEFDKDDATRIQEPDSKLLRNEPSDLPFGILMRAQSLAQPTGGENPSELLHSSGGCSQATPDLGRSPVSNFGGKLEFKFAKDWKKISKRSSKHAPSEITSKKPITRRRKAIEAAKIESRDPRFSALAGQFSPDVFASTYSFIPELQGVEVEALKKALQLAQKALSHAPKHLRDSKQEAVGMIQTALKRAESSIDRAKREERERLKLQEFKTKEQLERRRGKKDWWMKDSERRRLLLQSRFDSLAAEGGHIAIKAAMERRKRKSAQKDKRSRPFVRGQIETDPGLLDANQSERVLKRRRVE